MAGYKGRLVIAAVGLLLAVPSSSAYVDMAPTLGRIVREASAITVAEVDRFNPEKGAIILKKVRDLKGDSGADPIKHVVLRAGEAGIERPILEWAESGRRCVLFVSNKTTLVCLGEAWYQVHSSADGWWRLGAPRPDLPLAYYGSMSRLADAVTLMLGGKSAIITALPHGAEQQGASFDLALNRAALPGLVRVQRLRAHLNMPPMAAGVGANPAYVLGMGRAGSDEIHALREKLRAADATVRAESATDLGSLGPAAAESASDLAKLLDDGEPMVQAAAAALLRIKAGESRAVEVLAKGLAGDETRLRRHAARAAGLAGAAAAPLVAKLADRLTDTDVLVRRAALQAIATLGPAAAEAVGPVTRLLEQPETAIDAADALGRIGPTARPALKPLAKLLASEAATERWAAVRAMSQIGGEEAEPAVKFMIRELRTASEYDIYNMMIYLSLLGPVAKEAIPAIRNSQLKNPFLRQTTIWAIEPGPDPPWLGAFGNAPVAQYVFEAYVQELGDHLKPTALGLAKKIMAGSAGNVPGWGYKLLARFPEATLPILTPGLADKELVLRERAAVALGYMGRAAAPAKPHVLEALNATQDERERLLLKWCLREIDGLQHFSSP
jgi:HEAT repeat protein